MEVQEGNGPLLVPMVGCSLALLELLLCILLHIYLNNEMEHTHHGYVFLFCTCVQYLYAVLLPFSPQPADNSEPNRLYLGFLLLNRAIPINQRLHIDHDSITTLLLQKFPPQLGTCGKGLQEMEQRDTAR